MANRIPSTSSSVRFSESNVSDTSNILNHANTGSNDSHDHNNTSNDDNQSMKLFIATANLGNAAPDESSWNAWIPADGYYCTTTVGDGGRENQSFNTKYPLRRMIYSDSDSTTIGSKNHVKVNVESNESHYCMDTVPPNDSDSTISSNVYQQYDILIFGMQEATFDPPSKTNQTTKTDDNVETAKQPPGEDGEIVANENSIEQNIAATSIKNSNINPDHSEDLKNNDTNDDAMNHSTSSSKLKIKSPKKNTVQVVHDTLSHTTTKAVQNTTKAVQKIHRTTEKTIHKVQTLSTSRDHCKVVGTSSTITTPKSQRLSMLSSFPSVSSSSFFFGNSSSRRNHHLNTTNGNGKLGSSPLLNVIQDDESNYNCNNNDNIESDPLPTTTPTTTTTGWLDGTTLLLQLYQQRLPSYVPIVNYQRGEMRLIIYIHKKHYHDIQVKYVTAQNTGRAGLANKGGIVTELLCYNQTRISFLTAHLEAHEGYTKYMARIQSIADIFNGTTRHNHNAITSENSTQSSQLSSSVCIHDCSIASHYSFVMGDLNFRTEMSDDQKMALSIHDEDEYKQMIHKLIAEQRYDTLNDMDELHRGLYNKHCLVGYETLLCNFPPTFKVERQIGYHYIDKRRPSYTDRILFKSNLSKCNTNTIQPLLYEPIDNFKSSDHKPIRAAFTIQLNEPYMLRPKLTKRRSTLKLANLIHAKRKNNQKDFTASLELGQKERFHLFVTNMKCDIVDPNSRNSSQKVGSNSSLSLVTSTLQEIYTGTPNPYVCLISDPSELLHHQMEKGWNLFWNNIIKRTLHLNSSSHGNKRSKANSNHTCFLNSYGFPRSSIQRQRFAVEWDRNEEIHTEIRTHHADGSPIDLTGAMLRISVMNHRHGRSVIHKTTSAVTGATTDYVIGTVTINLVELMRQCRIPPAHRKGAPVSATRSDGVVPTKMQGGIEVQLSSDQTESQAKPATTGLTEIVDNVKCSATSNKSGNNNRNDEDDDDPIVRVDIDEPIVKNGIETGRLQCQLEIWWTDGTITKAFTPHSSTGSSNSKNNVGGRRRKRNNNRENISISSKSDIAASNFQRRPPLVPDRRITVTNGNN